MEMTELIQTLRYRLIDYRMAEKDKEISFHVSAIDIAVSLVDYALQTNPPRAIKKEEEGWFEAGYYLDLIFANSEWTDICDMYYQMVELVKMKNFFR
jgi:hypothetical protein